MPVGPAAFTNRLIRIVTRFDFSAGDEPFCLPGLKALIQEAQNLGLPFQIGRRRCAITFLACLRVHPADAVEALLKGVVRSRDKILVFPEPQSLPAPECVERDGGSHLRRDPVSRPVHGAAYAVGPGVSSFATFSISSALASWTISIRKDFVVLSGIRRAMVRVFWPMIQEGARGPASPSRGPSPRCSRGNSRPSIPFRWSLS